MLQFWRTWVGSVESDARVAIAGHDDGVLFYGEMPGRGSRPVAAVRSVSGGAQLQHVEHGPVHVDRVRHRSICVHCII